jgi:hypothetical protein
MNYCEKSARKVKYPIVWDTIDGTRTTVSNIEKSEVCPKSRVGHMEDVRRHHSHKDMGASHILTIGNNGKVARKY